MNTSEQQNGYAIQGYEGSFHHAAACLLFGDEVKVIPFDTFRQVARFVSAQNNHGGLMAIENSIAGSILSNYNLLNAFDLSVKGEIYLQINQHLLVNEGADLENIREVHSHTMALQQCMPFLEQYHWKLVETEDTALSARQLKESGSKHIAAIAGSFAASLYGLSVAVSDIHEMKNNYTRFLHVAKNAGNHLPGADKASVMFATDHSRGSLAKVLNVIAGKNINLSKLQSFPVQGSAFRYNFYADMEFDDLKDFENAMEEMKSMTSTLKTFGIYKKGIWK